MFVPKAMCSETSTRSKPETSSNSAHCVRCAQLAGGFAENDGIPIDSCIEVMGHGNSSRPIKCTPPYTSNTMSTTSRRGRPTQEQAKALEARLRTAAVSTFLENGYDGTTMEAVADAAGITKRTLYARYPDKHALFVSVIPWALSRLTERHSGEEPAGDDLEASLTAVGRGAIARVVDPETSRLRRMAMYESARFPEFALGAESMMYSAQVRAVVAVLHRHRDADRLVIDDIELTAEQFLAMVAVMPSRLADFGIVRSSEVEDRHLEHAVALFLRAVRPH